jgi:putative hemolysin
MPNLPPQAFFKAMTPNLVADHISRKNHPDSPPIDNSFHPFFSLSGHIAGRLFKLRKLDNIYSGLNTRADPFEFSRQALEKLRIHLLPTGKCGPIPRTGPLIIVANHPFGCLEGLALVQIISEVRRDVRFLANYFLNALPPATISQIKSLSELSVSEIARVVPELEEGRHSFPVLIRQYLKLGGRAAAFHHDRDFGSYDVLMVIDLCKTPRDTLRRYMGKNAENFTDKNFGSGQG